MKNKLVSQLKFTCIVGGLVIGIYEKLFQASPEDLETVMAVIKRDGKYRCDRLGIRTVGAALPLIFGASIGPEAGLTGIIAGLCFWAGERFRYVGKHLSELSQVGLGAALGVIFCTVLGGIGIDGIYHEKAGCRRFASDAVFSC